MKFLPVVLSGTRTLGSQSTFLNCHEWFRSICFRSKYVRLSELSEVRHRPWGGEEAGREPGGSQLVRLVIPQGPRLFEVETGRQVTWCRVPNIEGD